MRSGSLLISAYDTDNACSEQESLNQINAMQIQVGLITISDRASRGLYDDLGGPALKQAAEGYGWRVLHELLVPDERHEIQQAIRAQIA